LKKTYYIFIAIAFLTSCSTKEEKDISFELVNDFDFTQTLNKARKDDKTVLLYFSSIACVNCRRMEEEILINPEIKKTILKDYIFIPLVVDDRASAEKEYWKLSMFSDDTLKRIGEINSQFQIELTQSGSQPKFAIVSNDKQVLSTIGFTNDRIEFLKFLEKEK
jgi:thioredoxin-related protein